jgi:hypothetical protein
LRPQRRRLQRFDIFTGRITPVRHKNHISVELRQQFKTDGFFYRVVLIVCPRRRHCRGLPKSKPVKNDVIR